jgi:amino acid transporter
MATLDRAIGPFAATLLVIGGIIGSGIFLTTGPMVAARHLPSLILAGCSVRSSPYLALT